MTSPSDDIEIQRRNALVERFQRLDPGLRAFFSSRVSLGLHLAQELNIANGLIKEVEKDIAGLKKTMNLGLIALVIFIALAWLIDLQHSQFFGPVALMIYLLVTLVVQPLQRMRLESCIQRRDNLRLKGHALDLSTFYQCLDQDNSLEEGERLKAFNRMYIEVFTSLSRHAPEVI